MDLEAVSNEETLQRLHERLRQSAFWIGLVGSAVNIIAFVGLAVFGDVVPLLVAEVGVFAVVLSGIAICAHLDWYVRRVFIGGLLIIYAVFWIATYLLGDANISMMMAIPLGIFTPLLVTVALPPRVLYFVVPLQATVLFFYISRKALPALEASVAPADQLLFSLCMAVLSGATILAFAVLANERSYTDRQLVELVRKKERIASTDPLTDLLNRRAFMAQLEAQWPPSEPFAIAFIDLDHFKPLNDQYGHAMGDFMLKQVADRLRGTSAAVAAARLGGDEFALCCIGPRAHEDAGQIAAEIHNRIAAEFQTELGPISMGASVGYAVHDENVNTLSKVLRAADAAMRRAKSSRSGWATFDQEADSSALSSTSIEFELKAAVRSGQIRAAVQPVARASDLRVVEYELLARWVDSGFETDPGPAQFIPVAEKLGMLNDILWATLDEALGKLDLTEYRLAINVSPAQLLASDFFATLMNILSRHGTEPSRITLEVTEEVVFRNLERNVAVLERARGVGMAIALDDFGSGYSSLGMLDALPLDKLKIDRTLVTNALRSPRSLNILNAAIGLAQKLDLVACVEGIESEKEHKLVEPLGATQVQGFWIGRPRLLRSAKAAPLKLVARR